MKLHVNWLIIDAWMLYNILHTVVVQFGVRERKIRVLIWTPMQKTQILLLVQGDGRHPNDTLVFIALEALIDVNCLTGRPSWSPGRSGWDGRQWRVRWRVGRWASPWRWVTCHAAKMRVIRSIEWNYFVIMIFDMLLWIGCCLATVWRCLRFFYYVDWFNSLVFVWNIMSLFIMVIIQ